MEILINSLPVHFRLENEKNIADVIASVSGWARERELIFTEARINDEPYAVEALPDMPLEAVRSIDCVVRSRADVVISSLEEADAYCDRATAFIESALDAGRVDREAAASLEGGAGWLGEVVESTLSLLGTAPEETGCRDTNVREYLDRLNDFSSSVRSADSEDSLLAVFKTAGGVFSAIKEVLRMMLMSENLRRLVVQSLESPDVLVHSLEKIREEAPAQSEVLAETVQLYQQGRDSEASKKFHSFVEFVYDYTRACYQCVPVFRIDTSGIEIEGVTLEERNRELNDMLSEILSSLENNDIISLSDILEYEMRPRIETIGAYIDAVLAEIRD
ncbi:MAG TPA: hypothetical protein PKO25_11335 [Spirochaetota bacterium]|nr:MAG: hypothetical protein BWY96_02888 [Spirochaetes bacterium ADurb.BinA120]HNU92450.1 hypothetical protein [Spirochaetota bacterium]HPI16082.1 hypothetical protein [Spirochaetota bacterium]HPV98821.1 hypothetical protein [Spirochaetota bacterium]